MAVRPSPLSEADLAQLREWGIAPEEALRQLGLFKSPPRPLRLSRPCSTGDGIHILNEAQAQRLAKRWEEAQAEGRGLKFVPASGAASRMFRSLHALREGGVGRDALRRRAEAGDAQASEALSFFDNLDRFAFYEALRDSLERSGLDLFRLVRQERYAPIIEHLLGSSGLALGEKPKGALPFHRYGADVRTAFEEHVLEAAGYVADGGGLCRLHFTLSREHGPLFSDLAEKTLPARSQATGLRFDVDFSFQKPSTDTLAAGLDGLPARASDGSLLFWPGGHGALIENLSDLQGDIVFIKNIDNVVLDRAKPLSVLWKKALGGLLLEIQDEAFHHRAALSASLSEADARSCEDFFQRRFFLHAAGAQGGAETRRKRLTELLDRPIRVCGVVRNTGEPGGGPFWVEARGGGSLQIVEKAQVAAEPRQQEIFASSTHFNPVDLVCALRDWRGRPYDLRAFVDPDAVFLSKKSWEGRSVRVLERPGLWNGAMAGWNTVFVEVPLGTFQPVKTVGDLLREGHQV